MALAASISGVEQGGADARAETKGDHMHRSTATRAMTAEDNQFSSFLHVEEYRSSLDTLPPTFILSNLDSHRCPSGAKIMEPSSAIIKHLKQGQPRIPPTECQPCGMVWLAGSASVRNILSRSAAPTHVPSPLLIRLVPRKVELTPLDTELRNPVTYHIEYPRRDHPSAHRVRAEGLQV
jgi:hypothetical protein